MISVRSFLSLALIISFAWQLFYLIITGQLGSLGGREMTDIAERLVLGAGFSSPYLPVGEGGPTRVSPPLYVWLTASVYYLCGIKTELSHTLLQLFNIMFNLVSLVMLYRVVGHWFNEMSARVFALLFCFHPNLLLITRSTWETGLTLCLLSVILWFVVIRFRSNRTTHLVFLGVLLGVTALSNPAWTIAYPLICLVLLWPRAGNNKWRCSLLSLGILFLSYLLVVSPWLIRNYGIENKLSYVRNMSGPEWYKGNHSYAGGGHGQGFHDFWIYNSAEEQERYRQMGESAYDQWMAEQAIAEIKAAPLRYVQLTMLRVGMWWSGDWDVLQKWYRVEDTRKFAFGVLLTLAGILTSIFAFAGTWLLRKRWQRYWLLWVYIYLMPIPYYLIIVGFRYQSSLLAFVLIPASFFLAELISRRLKSG